MTKYVTRVAPSPTGDVHIGNARTAYFCWLAARASDGRFILRIDDTDQARNQAASVSVITETMAWLGLTSDHFFHQSDNLSHYRAVANDMVKAGVAHLVEGGAVALRYDAARMPATWHDRIHGPMTITVREIEILQDLILLRSDGMPTYHFASVVDDIETSVNLVIRGKDHISNTAKQVAIWSHLGEPIPEFAHLGLIFLNKQKLTKRDASASMLSYRDQGIDPDAMLNFMLRMGWGPYQDDRDKAVIPRERAIGLFLTEGKMLSKDIEMNPHALLAYDRKYKTMKRRQA